jgi:hypothetical protein
VSSFKLIIKIGEGYSGLGLWLKVEKFLRVTNLHLLIDLPGK